MQTTVVLDCPVCGRPLPPVALHVVAERWEAAASIMVDVEPELDYTWWSAAREQHPACMQPTAPGSVG